MKNNILLILGILSLMGMISAEVSVLGTYKVGECITLYQTCSDCTYVNYTSLLYPNGTLLKTDITMTKDGEDYYYPNLCIDQLGEYKYNTCGDLAGTVQCEYIYFYSTPTGGQENNLTTFLVMIIISVVILILAFVFKNNIFAFISGMALLGTGVYSMIYGFGEIYSLYTQIISVVIIGFGGLICITSALDEFGGGGGGGGGSYVSEDDD